MQALLHLDFEFVGYLQETRGTRWLMRLAARPLSLLFRRFSVPSLPLECGKSFTEGAAWYSRRDFATDFQQDFSWAAHDGKTRFARRSRHRQCSLTEQELGRDHRSFCFAMNRFHGAAHQLDLLNGSLVRAEEPFIFPTTMPSKR